MKRNKINYTKQEPIPQYFLGGALKKMLAPAAGIASSFIPGIGPAIAPIVTSGIGALTAEQQENIKRQSSYSGSTMGNFANGGKLSTNNPKNLMSKEEYEKFKKDYYAKLEKYGKGDPFRAHELDPTLGISTRILLDNAKIHEKGKSFNLQPIKSAYEQFENTAQKIGGETVDIAKKAFGFANGGALNFIGQNAFSFTGAPHEKGGIKFQNAEVEGGETMDFIQFKKGGMVDSRNGSPYIFSKRLKVPETNTSFADTHKMLVKKNASEDEIRNLAQMQEKLTGRSKEMNYDGSMKMQTGGTIPPLYKPYMDVRSPINYFTQGMNPLFNSNEEPITIPYRNNENVSNKTQSPTLAQKTISPTNYRNAPSIERDKLEPYFISPEIKDFPIQENNPKQKDNPKQKNNNLTSALQFIPEAMNFLTGAFGRGNIPEATQVSNRAVEMMDPRVNIEPQLLRNASSYRSIINDPNATPIQKLAAQSAKMQADSAVIADKINRENQMKSNQASIQASIDSQNAQYNNQARTERMQGNAMFGPFGNMARGAMSSTSQKLLLQQAQRNQKRQNDISAMAILSQLDPALQEKFAKQLGLFQ